MNLKKNICKQLYKFENSKKNVCSCRFVKKRSIMMSWFDQFTFSSVGRESKETNNFLQDGLVYML